MAESQGISIKGLVLGLLADIGATFAGSLAIGFLFGLLHASRGGSTPEDIERALNGSSSFLLALCFMGLLCSLLGGWVAGWIAGHSEVKHGVILGVIGLALGGLSLRAAPAQPMWSLALTFGLTIPACALGGHVRAEQRLRA